MKYSKFFFAAGLLALATACTNETEELENSAKLPVRLSYTTLQAVDTRAAASQTLNDDYIATGKDVMVRISNYNADSWNNYTYTTGDGGVLNIPAENPPYYPLNGTNIDVRAYYPAAVVSANGEHTVAADQSSDEAYVNSDLMCAFATNKAKTAEPIALQFAHKMAKVKIDVTPGTAVKQINWIKLKNVKPTASLTLSSGAIGEATGDATDIIIAKEEATDGKKIQGAAVFPAQTLTGALLEIGVTMADNSTGTATYTVDSKAFAANNVYTLDITVNGPEVNASTAITNWADNGSVTVFPSKSLQFSYGGTFFNMIYVQGGDYNTLGGVDVTGTLTDYFIGETEVTQALWKAVKGSVPADQTFTSGQAPVSQVSWDDICTASTGFLAKLNGMLASQLPAGMSFKLPTEAQWEYAARGGVNKNDYTYAGSNTIGDVAWHSNNAGSKVHAVGSLAPNALGLYDMSGNVWEWCQDGYGSIAENANLGSNYYAAPQYNSSARVGCGGGWFFPAERCAVSSRGSYAPSFRDAGIGFRLVLQ